MSSSEVPAVSESPLAILQPHLDGDIVSVLRQSPELSAPYLYAIAQHLGTTPNGVISSAGERAAASREGDPSHCMNTILNVRAPNVPHFLCYYIHSLIFLNSSPFLNILFVVLRPLVLPSVNASLEQRFRIREFWRCSRNSYLRNPSCIPFTWNFCKRVFLRNSIPLPSHMLSAMLFGPGHRRSCQ